jgi:hypothetical protein
MKGVYISDSRYIIQGYYMSSNMKIGYNMDIKSNRSFRSDY